MSQTELNDRDPELEGMLGTLDPGSSDDTYWPRFHRSVMTRAFEELARRRIAVNLTVAGLVSSWGRTLVPTAAAAAAVGAFFLLRPVPAPEVGLMAVEEELAQGIDGQSIPDVLADENLPDAAGVVFASEIF